MFDTISEISTHTMEFHSKNSKEVVVLQDNYPPLKQHVFYMYSTETFKTPGIYTIAVWKVKRKPINPPTI